MFDSAAMLLCETDYVLGAIMLSDMGAVLLHEMGAAQFLEM